MSERIPELDELGARLAAGRAASVRRRSVRLSRPALVGAFVLALAVPAVATRDLWAPLAGGETAVPPQAPAIVRTTLASGSGDAGPWRLVGYRARLRGGGIGTCLFVTAGGSGAGSCTPPGRPPATATHRAGPVSFVLAGADAGTRSVVVRWAGGERQVAPVRELALRDGGRVRFALAQRSGATGPPPELRSVSPSSEGGSSK